MFALYLPTLKIAPTMPTGNILLAYPRIFFYYSLLMLKLFSLSKISCNFYVSHVYSSSCYLNAEVFIPNLVNGYKYQM